MNEWNGNSLITAAISNRAQLRVWVLDVSRPGSRFFQHNPSGVTYKKTPLVAQLVKNPPTRWETWARSPGQESPWGRDQPSTPALLHRVCHGLCSPNSRTWPSDSHYLTALFPFPLACKMEELVLSIHMSVEKIRWYNSWKSISIQRQFTWRIWYQCSHCDCIIITTIDIQLLFQFSSVQFSHLVVSSSLWPHGLQHTRLPCPSPTPGACSNSCSSSWWCHPTISSSVFPFSFCLHLSQNQGLFQGVSSLHQVAIVLGVSATASVLPMNIQNWSPLGWTGWISLQSKGLSRVFSNTTVQKHQLNYCLSMFNEYPYLTMQCSSFCCCIAFIISKCLPWTPVELAFNVPSLSALCLRCEVK